MKGNVLTTHDVTRSAFIVDLIVEHSENMLILAFALTNNATRANRIVEDILLDIHMQNDLPVQRDSLHTWLYAQVKKACGESTISP
jgi:hypothetical protein